MSLSSPQADLPASSPAPKPPQKKLWLVPLLGSVVLLFLLSHFVNWQQFAQTLVQAHAPTLALAAAVFGVTLLLRSARFYVLLRSLANLGPHPRVGLELATLNNLANHILPFRLGELVFLFLATFAHQVKSERAVITLVTARLYDLVTLALLVLVHLPFFAQSLPFSVVALLALLGLSLLCLAIRLDWAVAVARLLLAPLSKIRKLAKLHALVDRLSQNLAALRTPTLVVQNLVLGLSIWSTLNLFFWLVLRGLGISLAWPQVVLGAAATGLSALLPINTVGSIGTLEAGWVLGFVWVGMNVEHAVSSSLVMHVIVIAVSALFAAPHAVRLGRTTLNNFWEWQHNARGH